MILAVAVSFDEITACHVQLNVSKIIKKRSLLFVLQWESSQCGSLQPSQVQFIYSGNIILYILYTKIYHFTCLLLSH